MYMYSDMYVHMFTGTVTVVHFFFHNHIFSFFFAAFRRILAIKSFQWS